MAQAARLSLRMQKELKLLLTDPPPAVSFPTLSGDSSASSLTSIDALLQGPEGTVYANGVFKIKIQIPERYPFQPPIVTFATPIYHPNIDNGGRICLDILNLPPKGMWQPSLNISTVLTSIGLLLSEPNPDDGLMHEASRDYKYNRQAFDQNARSMTEKYARSEETEIANSSHETEAHTGRDTAKSKVEGSSVSISTTEHRELSLRSSSNEMYKVSTHDYSKNNFEFGPQANSDLSKCTGKLRATRNKLALKVSVASLNETEDTTSLPTFCSSLLEIQTSSTYSPESTLSMQVGNRDEDHIERSCDITVGLDNQSLQGRNSDEKLQECLACSSGNKTNARGDAIDRKWNCSTNTRLKKTSLVVQNHLVDEKENLAPVQSLAHLQTNQPAASTYISPAASEIGLYYNESGKQMKSNVISDKKQQQKMNQVCVRESSTNHKSKQVVGGEVEGSLAAEAVIVLDSEESEDEIVPERSKLSLGKRCCRKRKSAH